MGPVTSGVLLLSKEEYSQSMGSKKGRRPMGVRDAPQSGGLFITILSPCLLALRNSSVLHLDNLPG